MACRPLCIPRIGQTQPYKDSTVPSSVSGEGRGVERCPFSPGGFAMGESVLLPGVEDEWGIVICPSVAAAQPMLLKE